MEEITKTDIEKDKNKQQTPVGIPKGVTKINKLYTNLDKQEKLKKGAEKNKRKRKTTGRNSPTGTEHKQKQVEYSEKQRRVKRRCFIRIMNNIISAIKLTSDEMDKYVYFITEILPTDETLVHPDG